MVSLGDFGRIQNLLAGIRAIYGLGLPIFATGIWYFGRPNVALQMSFK